MRFIIYGAGGIGSIMGGHLARIGHDVILVGRSGHIDAINAHGLSLVTPTGTHRLKIPAVTTPDRIDFRGDDLVFLCVKSQDTEGAMQDLSAVTTDVPVFCFQNGVRNEEIAAYNFSRVYGVMVRVGAVYLDDGEVTARRDPPGWYIIGRYPQGIDELAGKVAAELRTAGYFVRTTPDIMPYKWGKLMGNLGNGIGAITNGDWESIMPMFRAVYEESLAIVTEAGIPWISQEQVEQDWPEITAPLRGSLDVEAHSSTWQSLARHQGSVETDFFNGEIVRLAEKLGKKAPFNEMLIRISQEMAENREEPGKYTPAELSVMLGI